MNGIAPPVVTPFDAAAAIDREALASLVSALESAGVDFLVACGSTSEAALMSPDECAIVFETIVEAASVPVVAGTGRAGLHHTRALTERAADLGVDAAMVVTPYYYRHEQSALEAYYRDLADHVDLPIYLYVIPRFAHHHLSPDVIGGLASHPNIVGIKDSRGDLEALEAIIDHTRDEDFSVLTGSARLLPPALEVGATGAILAIANVIPEALAEIIRHHEQNSDRARSLHDDLTEFIEVFDDTGIPGLKAAMAYRDLPGGTVRAPFHPVDDPTVERIQTALDAVRR